MWIEFVKKWGEYDVGDITQAGDWKGSELITKGIAVKSKRPKPVAAPVETAVEDAPVETTDARPVIAKAKTTRRSRKKKGGE